MNTKGNLNPDEPKKTEFENLTGLGINRLI